ncbi:hypothetical protein BH23GEM9_BH23GEM9_32220 [soil metagenome]
MELVEAVVQVGDRETLYLRCGRGPRVVVVLAEEATERLRLVQRFARHSRVVAPVPPWEDVDVWPAAAATWLRGVIEGLGLDRPTVALAPTLALLAGALSRGADYVGDVIIAADDDDTAWLDPPVVGDGKERNEPPASA